MKQKEMLFDLESNELLELNQDGNPMETAEDVQPSVENEESEANINREEAQQDTAPKQTQSNVTQEANQNKSNTYSKSSKKKKKKQKREAEKAEAENRKKLENEKIREDVIDEEAINEEAIKTKSQATSIENQNRQEAASTQEEDTIDSNIERDIDLEFINTARKSTGKIDLSDIGEEMQGGTSKEVQTVKTSKKSQPGATESKKQKAGSVRARQGQNKPSETKIPSGIPIDSKEQIEKLKGAAQNAKEAIGKTAGNVAKASKPALEKTGEQAKKLWAAFKASAAKTTKNVQKDFGEGGIKRLIQRNKMTLTLGALIVVIGIGLYAIQFQSLPKLSETHKQTGGINYKSYDAEVHPMEILSTVKANMQEFKGAPSETGDGSSEEMRYVVYSMEWFGKNRKTVIYHDPTNTFNRIKLVVDNESAESLYEKLIKDLGQPTDESTPTVREGWAVWVKDAIRYKMMHRGSFTQIDMSIAKYDNTQNLPVGKYPIIIQSINNLDLNRDEVIDEKILLLGNRNNSTEISFSKLYLLVWDGKKTYIQEMDAEYDGGKYPQLQFIDIDGDDTEELVISAENNIVNNFNAFKYTGTALERVYSGYEEPGKNEQQPNQ